MRAQDSSTWSAGVLVVLASSLETKNSGESEKQLFPMLRVGEIFRPKSPFLFLSRGGKLFSLLRRKVSSRLLAKLFDLVTIFRWVIDLKTEWFCETFVRVENYWRKAFIERSKKGKIYKVPSTESDPLSVLALLLHITHIINFLCIVWDSLLPFLSRGGAQKTIKILVKLHKLLQKLSSGSRFLDKLRYPKRLFTRIACFAS